MVIQLHHKTKKQVIIDALFGLLFCLIIASYSFGAQVFTGTLSVCSNCTPYMYADCSAGGHYCGSASGFNPTTTVSAMASASDLPRQYIGWSPVGTLNTCGTGVSGWIGGSGYWSESPAYGTAWNTSGWHTGLQQEFNNAVFGALGLSSQYKSAAFSAGTTNANSWSWNTQAWYYCLAGSWNCTGQQPNNACVRTLWCPIKEWRRITERKQCNVSDSWSCYAFDGTHWFNCLTVTNYSGSSVCITGYSDWPWTLGSVYQCQFGTCNGCSPGGNGTCSYPSLPN